MGRGQNLLIFTAPPTVMADVRKDEVHPIRGVPVSFPFPPYHCQLEYMEKVVQALQEVSNCDTLLHFFPCIFRKQTPYWNPPLVLVRHSLYCVLHLHGGSSCPRPYLRPLGTWNRVRLYFYEFFFIFNFC